MVMVGRGMVFTDEVDAAFFLGTPDGVPRR
jgi:hypothetical protein